MRSAGVVAVLTLTCALPLFAQDPITTFKAQVRNAFLWGEDAPSGAISSSVRDPLTDTQILKLRYAGIEVSSRMGFEKARRELPWEFIAYTTTIANNTRERVTVKYGGIAVDGRIVPPVRVVPDARHLSKKENGVDVKGLYCFSSGFLSTENFFAAGEAPLGLMVEPQTSLSVSTVIKDPRSYPMLCAAGGCFPKGVIRYSIQVGGHDYVFTWSGRSVANCGN